ncbi:MAG TPA: hypothetical protein VJ770_10100 [Stellaceae bacterium]|nr:hypothetical protein [Stellaceae bacterium]
MTRPGRPDRRLAPRPFPAYLTSTTLSWLISRAALPASKSGWLPSSGKGTPLGALAAARPRRIARA